MPGAWRALERRAGRPARSDQIDVTDSLRDGLPLGKGRTDAAELLFRAGRGVLRGGKPREIVGVGTDDDPFRAAAAELEADLARLEVERDLAEILQDVGPQQKRRLVREP